MNWEPVIGLEIHVQLNTDSKIFSGASTAFGAEPNTQACAVDLGLPGVLPVLNYGAVRKAVTFGLAIGAQINKRSIFDRKNYFYPDLPKGYQISQFEQPIVGAGKIRLQRTDTHSSKKTGADTAERWINITRAHLEEDAGKSTHDLYSSSTAIDLNRTGTPLLEVVSEPELTSAAEAADYFRQMHALVRYLRICDGNLAEGSMRCDANVSVRPVGQVELGERSEIKNINSFRFVERAIDVEIQRQIDVLEAGGRVERDTRLYDPDKNETRSMRSKELSNDYRYFPDPDLLPLEITQAFIDEVAAELPELAEARQARYEAEHGLSAYDAAWLTKDPDIAEYFEVATTTSQDAKLAANWLMGDMSAALNRDDIEIAAAPVNAQQLGQLIARIKDGTISGKIAKGLFENLWQSKEANSDANAPDDIDAMIAEQGLEQVSDTGELSNIIHALVADNPDQVTQFRAGKDKVLGFFVGQVMKATQGKANPKTVNELLRAALSE